jgi:hypothetical protein
MLGKIASGLVKEPIKLAILITKNKKLIIAIPSGYSV